jgi:ubiquinone/menaquinone biosynthesis C-methylase UbiE
MSTCEITKGIASDHLAAARKLGQNPWIEESLWNEMERSTVKLIRKYTSPAQRILDVGVGLGRVLEGFSRSSIATA